MSSLVTPRRLAQGVVFSFALGLPSCLEDEPVAPPKPVACGRITVQSLHSAPVPRGVDDPRPLLLAPGEAARIEAVRDEAGRPLPAAIEGRFFELFTPFGVEPTELWVTLTEAAAVDRRYTIELAIAPSERRACFVVTAEAPWSFELESDVPLDEHHRIGVGERITLSPSLVGDPSSDLTFRWGMVMIGAEVSPAIAWFDGSDEERLTLQITLPARYEIVAELADEQGYVVERRFPLVVTDGPIATLVRNLAEGDPDVLTLGQAARVAWSGGESLAAHTLEWQLWRFAAEAEPEFRRWELYHGADPREWIPGESFRPTIRRSGKYRVVLRASSPDGEHFAYDAFAVE